MRMIWRAFAKDDNLSVVCKVVPDNPQWKEKAKVTIMSCLWQMAIWTAQRSSDLSDDTSNYFYTETLAQSDQAGSCA